ncbi:MAG: DNA-3-methyladenine glycosylase [Bdellovibrionales bacterium]
MILTCATAEEFKSARRKLMKSDEKLKALLKKHRGFSFSPRLERTPFESLVRAIAHQQLHGKAAETILGRMLELFPSQSFPSAEALMKIEDAALRGCGYSGSKVKSIKDIAAKTVSGLVPGKKEILTLTNDEIIGRLTEIYGVGRWTVEMLLIFQLGRLDVWPVDDFGVRRGFQLWQKKRKMPTAKDLRKVGGKWAPYQTVVALYLWQEANQAK